MPKEYSGKLSGKGRSFAIVIGRFNEFITRKLLEGALDMLERHEVADEDVSVYWVPGAFEIPAVARRVAQDTACHAVLCLGAVIRGGTPHFDYVAAEAAKGVAQAGFASAKPVVFGVITADTLEQAIERAGTKAGNKGAEAALAALEMADLYAEMGP